MTEARLGQATQQLLKQINDIFPGEIMVRLGNENSGTIRYDQATRDMMGSRLLIQVNDVTAPDYTATHELMHILMSLTGFPQVMFDLKFADDQFTEQLMIMTTRLYDVVAHQIIVQEQRKHGLITPAVMDAYADGVTATLTKEGDQNDDEAALRLLTLLDAFTFFNGEEDKRKYMNRFRKDYPIAYAAAKELHGQITRKPINSPFTMRRAIVKLFKGFDEQMAAWNMPELHATEYATVTSVLSKRQAGMQVRQIFEVFHSEMLDKKTGERAYVGLNRVDRQNGFVIAIPEAVTGGSTEWFKQLYDMTVAELFESIAMPFTLRDEEPNETDNEEA